MKRFFIALVLLISVQLVGAQVKTPDVAKKALEKALEASKDEKKATKTATWMKLATAYMDAYNAPTGSLYAGASQQEVQLLLAGKQPMFTEKAIIAGEPCKKEVYNDKALYYNKMGQLVMIIVTKPIVEEPLEGAMNAYAKAYETDTKKSKASEISKALDVLAKKFHDDGMNQYTIENYAKASELFEKAMLASAMEPLSKVDTTAMYNAGFTALMNKDYPRAKKFFEGCLNVGYYYKDGEVFAKLAEINTALGDTEAARELLEKGFALYPQSQSILIGLINYYLTNNKEPNKLFELISLAKVNEPDNASLYYVEGNIYNELRQADPAKAEEYISKAVAAYDGCAKVNPSYVFGHIGKGVMYYNIALELQDKAANELDDAKWAKLNEQFSEALKNALAPFEVAYNMSKDKELKVNVAEYLKNIYYRFSSDGPEFEAGYKKYNEVVKTGKPL